MLRANYLRAFTTEEVCNTTGVTSGAAEFIPVFSGIRVTQSLVFCVVSCQTPDSFRFRYRTWFIRSIQLLVEGSVWTGAGNCPEFGIL